MRFVRVWMIVAIGLASRASAQQVATTVSRSADAPGPFVVKTVPLHHLTSKEAVKLLAPYSQTPGGGVYEAPTNISAVTIREMPKIVTEMLAVLAEYDRQPATVTLSFQLVSAENTTTRDPAVASLDSLLRGVLKFSGYRLLGTSVATAGENGRVSQNLSADGDQLTLNVEVSDLRIEGNNASVRLDVDLWRMINPAKGQPGGKVLSTGVTVPIGQTVVLGTSTTDGGQRALILTVRPQLAKR
jgi:hypothetical protein